MVRADTYSPVQSVSVRLLAGGKRLFPLCSIAASSSTSKNAGSPFITILRRAAATPAPSLRDRFFLVRDGLGLIIPPTREATFLKRVFCLPIFAPMAPSPPRESAANH